jgi:hypothetical protein
MPRLADHLRRQRLAYAVQQRPAAPAHAPPGHPLIRRRNAFQTGAARALAAALTDWPHKPLRADT